MYTIFVLLTKRDVSNYFYIIFWINHIHGNIEKRNRFLSQNSNLRASYVVRTNELSSYIQKGSQIFSFEEAHEIAEKLIHRVSN